MTEEVKTNSSNNNPPKTNEEERKPRIFIDVFETPTGSMKISTRIGGKHFVGFINEKQEQKRDGTPYSKKYAVLEICTWEKCRICSADDFQIIV